MKIIITLNRRMIRSKKLAVYYDNIHKNQVVICAE